MSNGSPDCEVIANYDLQPNRVSVGVIHLFLANYSVKDRLARFRRNAPSVRRCSSRRRRLADVGEVALTFRGNCLSIDHLTVPSMKPTIRYQLGKIMIMADGLRSMPIKVLRSCTKVACDL